MHLYLRVIIFVMTVRYNIFYERVSLALSKIVRRTAHFPVIY